MITDQTDQRDQPRTMVITGATGFIGSRLALLALARGYSVRTISRSNWDGLPAIPSHARYFGSLPDRIPAQALAGAQVIVHCAAWVREDDALAHAVNVEGTMKLVDLAVQNGVGTFIFLSSQSAKPDALSAYGKSKYAAEQSLLNRNGIHVIILRPGLVTGPGSHGMYHRMCSMVDSLPFLPLIGGGRSIVQPIHVDDLGAAIFKCDELASCLNKRVLKLGHSEGMPLREFLQAIALVRLGHKKPTLSIPFWPVSIFVRLCEALGLTITISSTNLKGLRVAERMETGRDLALLDLHLRPLEVMLS